MLSNLSNNNAGNQTKSVIEKKHYEAIEDRLDELQDAIDSNTESINQNAQDISGLDERMGVVEENSTFPELNTDTINPATGDKVEITSDLDVDGEVEANSVKTNSLSVNGTNFTTVKDNAAQAKSTAETAKNKADEAYDLADAVADELADYKADNEQSITTGTLNADSVVADSVAAQTINTNDFETTNAEIDKLYVDTIKATGFLELPTSGQQYYTITIPAKTTASLSGVYTSDNNTDYPFYFTVSDGAVIYKQGSTEIIKDISFDRETGYTKVRVKSSTNLTYISSALDSNPVTIEDGGDAYTDYAFIPQKTGGYLIRGYDDTTTEVYIAGVLKAYAMSIEEEIIERTSVDFLKVNASIELPKEWDAGGTISYSTGEENEYISAQKKAGVTKPTWTSPIHSTIGSLSYSSKLVDEATVASYKGISETRQTQTISITNEASLEQLTAFHWTKNGNYWQPYELTRITIGDNTMWIDPTEANQGIRFYDNQVIADGTWDDVPVEEANAVPVNLVIFDAPTELSFPITNLGDKTTVHGEITATCFKGNVLGNVTGNADTATNATCFDSKTYAEAKADILSGKAAQATLADLATNSTCFDGKTYSQACTDILSGNAATATNANNADNFDGKDYATVKADILSGKAASATNADNATCFDGHTYACAKADILSGNAASATNATCFDGKTYAQAKSDILSGCAANADNATCFNGCTYEQAKTDILSGTAAQAHCVDIDSLTTNSYPLVMESTTCELGKSGTCPITFAPSTGILETTQISTSCIENSGTVQSQCLCATCDLNVDGSAFITGDLTVQGTITTTHSEEVVTPSENIILRDGATTPIASGCYSGFTVTNYDGQNNLEVGADKDGTLHVGVVGGTMEPIATRATEACMEDGYAAHWDSTGTDLVTKGATNTHDLTVNGNASVTGNLSVTGTLTADLTGNVTGNVTGNADTATNATCFGGKTYAQAKTDILSGCAADSNKLAGKTYAQTRADILSGNAASASYATQVVPFCASEDEEKNLAFFDSDVDCGNPDTIQYDGGKQLTFNPVSNNLTVAGDVKAKNAVRKGEYYNISSANVGKYVLLAQASYAYNGNHDLSLAGSITNGSFMLNRFSLSARASGSAVEGSLFRMLYNVGNYYKATYEFDAASATITVRLYAKLTSKYQRIRIVIDNFTKGDVYPFVSTYDSALTLPMTVSATMTGTEITTTYVKVENASCADDSTCFNGCTYEQAKSDIRSGLISDIGIDVNCGSTCVCTLNNGSTLALSANAFNENATISTDTYPGVCCTGTSNYVVTTMVCCAKQVCRNQAATGTWHLALFPSNTACDSSSIHASSACPITYSPATGTLCACILHNNLGVVSATKVNIKASDVGLTAGCAYDFQCVITQLTCCFCGQPAIYTACFQNSTDFYVCLDGSHCDYFYNYVFEKLDCANPIACAWQIAHWRVSNKAGSEWIVEDTSRATANVHTWTVAENIPTASCINTSSSNAEYPLVFSTCCATPAAGNRTLYNDSANNLMYNPSTNTLKATCFDGTINMNCVADAAYTNVAANSITRKTILRNQITNVGYITSAAIGLCRGTSGFGQALLSVSCNDAATAWKDYCFNNTGTISANGLRLRNDGGVNTGVYMKVGTASSNANRNIMFTPAVPGCDDTSTAEVQTSTGCPLTFNPATGVLTTTCFCGTATNATCFGGCTYAQAKADILSGTATTSEYTCINDVNTGAQNILMTSATGTLGVVNASTGTNACPLTYNPATGVLNACEVDTNIIKLGELDYITNGVDTGETWNGEMLISNYDGFTICAKHPTCHSSDYNWPYAVACSYYTSLGVRARASGCAVAIGLRACADFCSVAAGCGATACDCAIAIGYEASANDGSIAIGCGVRAGCVGNVYTSTINIGSTVYNSSNAGIAIVSWRCDTKQCDLYNSLACTFCKQRVIACNVAKRIGFIPNFIIKCCSGEIISTGGNNNYSLYHCLLSANCGVFYINYDYTGDRCYTINQGCTDLMPATTGYNSSTSIYIYY